MKHTAPLGIEDIGGKLRVTASLAEALIDNYLHLNAERVCNKAARDVLSEGSFNDSQTGYAYNVICTYGVISDCVRILWERITEAAQEIEEIAQNATTPA